MNIFNHLKVVMLMVILSLRHRVICDEVEKVRIRCSNLEHQKAVNVTSLVGHWDGTQLVTHNGSDLEGVYDIGKCIRVFIEEDLQWDWSRQLETCQLSWHVSTFYRLQGPQLRRLRLHWHEGSRSTQYAAFYEGKFLSSRNGGNYVARTNFWAGRDSHPNPPDHLPRAYTQGYIHYNDRRDEPCTKLLEPLGKMTVILATSELLVVTVCQREPPALYTAVLGRHWAPRPITQGHLPRHINRLLRRHGLSTSSTEYLCAGVEPNRVGIMAFLGSLLVIMAGRVLMG